MEEEIIPWEPAQVAAYVQDSLDDAPHTLPLRRETFEKVLEQEYTKAGMRMEPYYRAGENRGRPETPDGELAKPCMTDIYLHF